MEYQNCYTINQVSQLIWVEMNDDAHGTYNTSRQIKF